MRMFCTSYISCKTQTTTATCPLKDRKDWTVGQISDAGGNVQNHPFLRPPCGFLATADSHPPKPVWLYRPQLSSWFVTSEITWTICSSVAILSQLFCGGRRRAAGFILAAILRLLWSKPGVKETFYTSSKTGKAVSVGSKRFTRQKWMRPVIKDSHVPTVSERWIVFCKVVRYAQNLGGGR